MDILSDYENKIYCFGGDILTAANMQQEKNYLQHGNISVFQHSVSVAYVCLLLADRFSISVNERALVRGALLHDYFLYDWHLPDKQHRFHGFTHPNRALQNAKQEFSLTLIEQDMIAKHMFPLTVVPPKYRESVLLCIADKLCALCETFYLPYFRPAILI